MQDLLNPNISSKPYMNIYCKSITLDNSGGSITPLNYYEEFNFNTHLQGPWTDNPSLVTKITRVGRTVTMTSTVICTGTFIAPSFATLVDLIPQRFRYNGGNELRLFNHVVNNGLGVQSHADISPSGQITFSVNGAPFSAVPLSSGTVIVLPFSFVWTI